MVKKKISAGGKLSQKKILKKSQVTLVMPEYKKESVLGDDNRFFKEKQEEAKYSLFFQ